MLMYAIIGAVVAGVAMAIAHSKAKQGIAWGQPLEIVFGILAIGFGFWAVYENTFGKSNVQKTAEKWQVVRGIGAAEWLNQNCKDKKLLLVRSYEIPGHPDIQFETVLKKLDGLTYEVLQTPKPTERGPEEAGPEMMMLEAGAQLTPAAKKLMQKMSTEMDDAFKAQISPDKYDTVVFFTSLYDFMLYPKPVGVISALKDKQYVFMFGVEDAKLRIYNKQIMACVSDKPLKTPEDYDKDPQGDQKADFDFRFEIKTPPTKKK